MNKITRCYLSALALSCAQVQAAPILQVQDGILTGAKHVEVAGAYYDVEFLDGTCIAIFTGCDNATDFTFTTKAAVGIAAQALLEQVFIDGPNGAFDTQSDLTRGCVSSHVGLCMIGTPYGVEPQANGSALTVFGAHTVNYPTDRTVWDFVNDGHAACVTYYTCDYIIANNQINSIDHDWKTFARWTPSTPNNTPDPTSVPEPGTLALLSLGLLGSLVVRRKAN